MVPVRYAGNPVKFPVLRACVTEAFADVKSGNDSVIGGRVVGAYAEVGCVGSVPSLLFRIVVPTLVPAPTVGASRSEVTGLACGILE